MLIPLRTTTMSRSFQFAGFLLSALTIATVALSQQTSRTAEAGVLAIGATAAKARLSRAVELRDTEIRLPLMNACGDGRPAVDRNGREIRRVCAYGVAQTAMP